jgi:uncharacterized membrane protein YbhN (UPF0104 family)
LTTRIKYAFWLRISKIFILLLSIWMLYKELFLREKFTLFIQSLTGETSWISPFWFFTGALLVLLNWGLETRKWQVLVRSYERIGYFKAFGAVLTGIFVSFFTPNRVGEFAGRIIYLDYSKKWEAALSTVVGSFSQLLCTLVFGILAFFFYISFESTYINSYYTGVFVFLWLLVLLSSVLLFLNIDRLYSLLVWLKLPKKWIRHFVVLRKIKSTLLLRVWWLSALRYVVFTFQYYFFLKAFYVSIPLHHTLVCTGTLFLLQSLVPTFALSELTMRGASAQHIFGSFQDKPAEIIMATYSIWLINIFIPALAGSVVFLFKRTKHVD